MDKETMAVAQRLYKTYNQRVTEYLDGHISAPITVAKSALQLATLGHILRTAESKTPNKIVVDSLNLKINNASGDTIRTLEQWSMRRREAKMELPPSLRDLYDEIRVLKRDFGLEFHLREKWLGVVTAAIDMTDQNGKIYHFGRFRIKLSLDALSTCNVAEHETLFATALEPRPAIGNPNITHPHISGSHICLGSAEKAAGKAIREGRLIDVFTLVLQTLQQYNPDSPYRVLEYWDGMPCNNCQAPVNPEDPQCKCRRCRHFYCEECRKECPSCEGMYCPSCTYEIEGKRYCGNCVRRCRSCEAKIGKPTPGQPDKAACSNGCGAYCITCLKKCKGCDRGYCPYCFQGMTDDQRTNGYCNRCCSICKTCTRRKPRGELRQNHGCCSACVETSRDVSTPEAVEKAFQREKASETTAVRTNTRRSWTVTDGTYHGRPFFRRTSTRVAPSPDARYHAFLDECNCVYHAALVGYGSLPRDPDRGGTGTRLQARVDRVC